MVMLSIECSSGMQSFLDELSQPNAFADKPYDKHRLVCGALAFWIAAMLRGKVNERQLQACLDKTENEYLFDLAASYLKAERGVAGYRIDEDKLVYAPKLQLT